MKLGEMQRFNPAHVQIPVVDAFPRAVCIPSADGEYVLFSDAQSKSLADERRIAAERTQRDNLNNALARLLQHARNGYVPAAEMAHARIILDEDAALRVETQEESK